MTLDEAIKHSKDKAREQMYYANFERGSNFSSCIKCAGEHEQLAEWLEELKLYKSKFKEILLYDHEIAEIKIYHKAIDDFAEKIATYGTYDDYGNVVDILEIAEKLKAGRRDAISRC